MITPVAQTRVDLEGPDRKSIKEISFGISNSNTEEEKTKCDNFDDRKLREGNKRKLMRPSIVTYFDSSQWGAVSRPFYG